MEYQPSRRFIVLMSGFAACGVAGAWGWNRMNSVPQEVRAKADLWKILTYKRPSVFEPPTPAEVARVKGEVDKMKAELVATHPLLAINARTVPADRNAFLRLHLLTGPGEVPHKTVSRELATAMDKDNKATWDAARMRTLLEGPQELIAELRLIGGLRERSSNGMPDDYTGFVSGREIANQAKVLLHSAKLAALDGNPGQALNDVKCVTAMASHYQEVEGTNLLMATIRELTRIFRTEFRKSGILLKNLSSFASIGVHSRLGDP